MVLQNVLFSNISKDNFTDILIFYKGNSEVSNNEVDNYNKAAHNTLNVEHVKHVIIYII